MRDANDNGKACENTLDALRNIVLSPSIAPNQISTGTSAQTCENFYADNDTLTDRNKGDRLYGGADEMNLRMLAMMQQSFTINARNPQ